MKRAKPTTKNVWDTTDTACLLRNKHSLQDYGRFTLWGKQKWVNLETTVLTVAKLRLPDEVKKIEKTWPNIANLSPSQITPAGVQEWIARFKRDGTNFKPKGAKTALKGNSATSVNRAIDTLRRILDIALERGQIHTNPVSVKPAEGRLKKR